MLPVVQLNGHNGQVPEAKIILGPKIGQNLDSPPSYVTAMQGSEQAPPLLESGFATFQLQLLRLLCRPSSQSAPSDLTQAADL